MRKHLKIKQDKGQRTKFTDANLVHFYNKKKKCVKYSLISKSSDPGGGPFPAVLDLYTFSGVLSEKRAALLASRGFLVLAVALYGREDMPKSIKELHLDYFEEAIEFLKEHKKVSF